MPVVHFTKKALGKVLLCYSFTWGKAAFSIVKTYRGTQVFVNLFCKILSLTLVTVEMRHSYV